MSTNLTEHTQKKAEECYTTAEMILKRENNTLTNIEDALRLLNHAANLGYTPAETYLADLYYFGLHGVEKNVKQAIYWFERAAEKEDPIACYNLGSLYYEGKEVPQSLLKAIGYLNLAAKANEPDALSLLGHIYYVGKEGVQQDKKKGLEFFSLAANQGHISSQRALGWIYANDEEITRNIETSISWYLKAALQDDVQSQYALGEILYTIPGLFQDKTRGLQWIKIARDNGSLEAQKFLSQENSDKKTKVESVDVIIQKISILLNEAIKEPKKIEEVRKYIAQLNACILDTPQLAKINKILSKYVGIAPWDVSRSLFFIFEEMAILGDKFACVQTATFYILGTFTEKDFEKARKYASTAARANSGRGLYLLGLIYTHLDNKPKIGKQFLERAQEAGFAVKGDKFEILLIESLTGKALTDGTSKDSTDEKMKPDAFIPAFNRSSADVDNGSKADRKNRAR